MVTTVEEAVRDGLTRYPTLFRTRGDVLWHLLVVVGNGYEWEDGGPVAVFWNDDRDPYWAARKCTADARECGDPLADLYFTMATNYRDDIATLLDGVEDRAHRMALTPQNCPRRPDSQYSFLRRDDARPDWAQAITEMRALYAETMAAQAAHEQAEAAALRALAESLHTSTTAERLADVLLSLPDGERIVRAVAEKLKG